MCAEATPGNDGCSGFTPQVLLDFAQKAVRRPHTLRPMHSITGVRHLVAGRYRLLDQLGRGAMGIVWHGHDDLLEREVAIKQILLPPLSSQAQAGASFQRTIREARAAARLSHPGVA